MKTIPNKQENSPTGKKKYQKPVLAGETAYEAAGANTCGKTPGVCTSAGTKQNKTSTIS